MNTTTQKRITLATLKSFIKKNAGELYINVHSSFDGMTDGIERLNGGWQKATKDTTQSKNSDYNDNTLGIKGVWLVGGSRDYFRPFNENGFTGINAYNSCGSFTAAIKS